jgi:hypothetical protein
MFWALAARDGEQAVLKVTFFNSTTSNSPTHFASERATSNFSTNSTNSNHCHSLSVPTNEIKIISNYPESLKSIITLS